MKNYDKMMDEGDAFHRQMIERYMTRSCLNCDSFERVHETCGRANDTRPPAQVIVFGCPAWTDLIPF